MKNKDRILALAKSYDLMRKETLRILKLAKSSVVSINDAQIIHSYLDKTDFYYKDDLFPIIKLIERYKIKSSLKKLWGEYTAIEKELLKTKIDFKNLGLKNISIGPISVHADLNNDSVLSITTNLNEDRLAIDIFPNDEGTQSDTYVKFIEEFKTKINNFLEKEIK